MRYVNLSIHDITKSTIEQVRQLVEIVREEGINKISFLLIPSYHNKESILEVCQEIKSLTFGGEIILHGYTHLGERFSSLSYKHIFTSYEGEFVCFDDVQDRLKKCIEMLEKCGLKAFGFIPPAWLMRRQDLNILKGLGFRFTTDRRYLYDLQTGKRYLSPVITFSSRRPIQELSVLYVYMAKVFIKHLKLVRIALHPPDIKSKAKIKALKNVLKNIDGRRIVLFTEYLNEVNLTKHK